MKFTERAFIKCDTLHEGQHSNDYDTAVSERHK